MTTHRRDFLKTMGIAAAVGSVCPGTAFAAPRKDHQNLVILHVDDLGWLDLGCMGSPVYETPHIDALAKSGTLYTSAYAGAPLCSPARAVLLTGSQPTRHGVYTVVKNRGKKPTAKVIPLNNNQFLPKEYSTIGTVLSKAGIANGSIGKWHLSLAPSQQGFSESKWGSYLGLPINYFSPFVLGYLPQDVPDGSYLPKYVREAGVDFLEKHQKEQFLLYFSTYLPHDEIKNKDEDSTLSAPKAVVDKYTKKIAATKKAGKDLLGHDNPVYAAMIEETDNSVGAIMQKLDELGLRKNTLVIFISDNGGVSKYTSQEPLRDGKNSLYEGGIRVPMIASLPGRIAAGKISDEPVSGIDLYPTMCSFLGVKPADPSKVDGEDLTDLLFKGKSLGERNLFWNYPCHWYPKPRGPRNALRRGDWKIHHFYTDNTYELYNLKDDIGETQDLSKTDKTTFTRMRKELDKTYQRFNVPATLPDNPDYDPAAAKAYIEEHPRAPLPKAVSTKACYAKLGLGK
jgi:arylsulfatase A-like enzyme